MPAERPTPGFGLSCLVSLMGLGLVGCLDARDMPATGRSQCTACHGSPTRAGDEEARAAPPVDLDGHTTPEYAGVGAHQTHLVASATHAAVACTECHQVPHEVFDPGHLDTRPPAELTFGKLAAQGDRTPAYDPGSRTCTATYCHGDATPVWTAPKTSEDACGSCHETPPPPPHPTATNCSRCHGAVVDVDQNFVDPALHVDGTVQVGGDDCFSCHGSPSSPAPPTDLSGSSDRSSAGVGAHQLHLDGQNAYRPVACEDCHVVPETVDAPGHHDATPSSEVTFSGLAVMNGATPSYDRATLVCSGTYCHGPKNPAGSQTPLWNSESPIECNSCHGNPPEPPHPAAADCSRCHGEVIDASLNFINPGLHADGQVQVTTSSCSSCHGSPNSPAPPVDLSGSSDHSSPGVGAHQPHLEGQGAYRPVACDECHVVPETFDAPGHLDSTPSAEVVFSRIATANRAAPSFDGTTLVCSGTYCHGPSNPATSVTPAWNFTTGPLGCDACHGAPPPLPHPRVADCSRCHGAVVDVSRNFVNPGLHANGSLQVILSLTCSSCHGSPSSPAPPADLSGSSDRSSPGVGAHQAHLNGGSSSRPIPCQVCHVLPATADDPGHLDSWDRAEVIFSGLATTAGSIPSFDPSTLRCDSTYCHAPISPAGRVSPVWNLTTGPLGCDACHGVLPDTPSHARISDTQCPQCHSNTVLSGGVVQIVDRSLHVDGKVDF